VDRGYYYIMYGLGVKQVIGIKAKRIDSYPLQHIMCIQTFKVLANLQRICCVQSQQNENKTEHYAFRFQIPHL
jgi:hypothetical protein